MKDKINVGIIGFGYWGSIYKRVISEIDGIKIRYICDSNINTKERLTDPIEFFDDPHKAIEYGGAEAIFIVTPANTHKEIIIDALKHNINTYVEKPAVLSSLDLRDVLRSKNSETIFFPGHIYAHNELAKTFVQYIAEKQDEIISVLSSRKSFGPIRQDVGCLWDLFPHDLTIFDMLNIGLPSSVSCIGSHPLGNVNEDIAHCEIKYSGGVDTSSDLSWIYPNKVRQTSVLSSRSMYIFDETNPFMPLGLIECTNGISRCANEIAYKRLSVEQYTTGIPYLSSEPLKNMVMSFISAITEGGTQADEEISRAKRLIPVIESAVESIIKGGKRINIKYDQ